MSKITLYGLDLSPFVRACHLTLNAMEQPYEFKLVDLFKGEHLTEEFQKHNPQHTVPVLDDNGFWIWDSHAIIAYLIDKHGKNDQLYPKDLQKRAIVNQRLFFEASVLTFHLRTIVLPMYMRNETVVPKHTTDGVLDAYNHMENFLKDTTYLAGENLTIADLSCIATISSLHGLVPIKAEKYPKLSAWVERLEKLPYYEKSNGKANKEYIKFLMERFTKIEL